jgi:hypothetical protein
MTRGFRAPAAIAGAEASPRSTLRECRGGHPATSADFARIVRPTWCASPLFRWQLSFVHRPSLLSFPGEKGEG